FKEARAMMVTDELDECLGVRLPIFRKALQIFENGVETGCRKDANCILGIFVEVGVENAHVLKVSLSIYVEKVPSEVMQLEQHRRRDSAIYPHLLAKCSACNADLTNFHAGSMISVGFIS